MNFEGKTLLDKISIIVRGIGLIVLYMFAGALISAILPHIPLFKYAIGRNILLILSEVLIVAILIIVFYERFFKDLKDFKKNYKKYLKQVIPYWIVGLIIMAFANIIINTIINENGLAANEAANRSVLTSLPLYSILSMCIFAPISEELLFRASFKNAFSNIIWFCLFSGIFFAGMHVATGIESWSIASILKNWKELLYFIPYGSMGIAFSYAFYKTDNIFSSISLHMLQNTMSVILILSAYILGA